MVAKEKQKIKNFKMTELKRGLPDLFYLSHRRPSVSALLHILHTHSPKIKHRKGYRTQTIHKVQGKWSIIQTFKEVKFIGLRLARIQHRTFNLEELSYMKSKFETCLTNLSTFDSHPLNYSREFTVVRLFTIQRLFSYFINRIQFPIAV